MKVLITGGAGFIGYHLARSHLDRGDNVIIWDNYAKDGGQADQAFQELAAHPRLRATQVDLTLPLAGVDAGSAFDIVYHLAAINGTRLFYEEPYEVARVNLLTTIHLLDWLRGRTVGRLLYASTSEVYAGCEDVGLLELPTHEKTPVVFAQPTPVRFSYGTSKFMGEVLCQHYGQRYGVPTSVVRYHNVYGPRMGTRHVVPELWLRVKAGERPLRVYGGRETRAFCYVDDVVEATWRVATTAACAGEIIHIGNAAEELSILSLAKTLMEVMGTTAELVEGERRAGSVLRRCPDTSKLERLTGFRAQVSLREGLARTVRWFETSHATSPSHGPAKRAPALPGGGMSPHAERGPAEATGVPVGLHAPRFSVVIPVYNEKVNVEPTAQRVLAALGPLAAASELLFVDDLSPDGTAAEVERVARRVPQVILVQHGRKEGLGAAHHAGYHAARGAYVLCLDADGSQEPADLLRMTALLDAGYDLVVGSRYLAAGRQIGKRWLRRWGSQGMNAIARVLLGIPLTDATHTFRAFRRSVHEAVCQRLDQQGHPGFQIQFAFWASRQGFRMTEIPITFVERGASRGVSKISIRQEVPSFLRLVGRLWAQRALAPHFTITRPSR